MNFFFAGTAKAKMAMFLSELETGYEATLVACGWAGTEFEVFTLEYLGKSSEAKDRKTLKSNRPFKLH